MEKMQIVETEQGPLVIEKGNVIDEIKKDQVSHIEIFLVFNFFLKSILLFFLKFFVFIISIIV